MKIPVDLAQVEQVRHRQEGVHLCHFSPDFVDDSIAGTGGTGENQPIAYARARACNSTSSFRNILIILKSACSTCDGGKMIDVSPVPTARASLFQLCQIGG
jgi:hypothetical protein